MFLLMKGETSFLEDKDQGDKDVFFLDFPIFLNQNPQPRTNSPISASQPKSTSLKNEEMKGKPAQLFTGPCRSTQGERQSLNLCQFNHRIMSLVLILKVLRGFYNILKISYISLQQEELAVIAYCHAHFISLHIWSS
ncbi:uncharacterized protein LOC127809757 isoform X4 [Diospyros lotus]|uniref:uncharacterized protein LOC127809757 isoform X4 n=1 Tax=Diospyros lotus TaxID=55363 RepID=UPI0022514D99|nr:uncharacterized protein LOC127809757 isoform X4 [Diospyros lotus]